MIISASVRQFFHYCTYHYGFGCLLLCFLYGKSSASGNMKTAVSFFFFLYKRQEIEIYFMLYFSFTGKLIYSKCVK